MAKKKNLKGIDQEDIELINEKMKCFDSQNLDGPSKSKIAREIKINLKCKTESQKKFLNVLKSKRVCISNAPAGVGKTYISLSYALKQLKDGAIERIVVVVPTCEAGGAELKIGLLPGTYEEKIEVYKMNIFNVVEQILADGGNSFPKSTAKHLFDSKMIDFRILNFMRGASIKDSILYADECENFNKSEVLLLLTRIQNSQIILTGDLAQNDRKSSKKECGLVHAIEALGDMEEVGVAEFSAKDIVRDPLITKILEKW